MSPIGYSIAPEIFSAFPDYRRGVVLLRGVQNGPSPEHLQQRLREVESTVRSNFDVEKITEVPRIAVWRDAFRKIGIKATDFRPSVEALLRRVLRGQDIPSINMLVDIGNLISLRYLVPIGGHAVDCISEDIALKPATGEEMFNPFGTDTVEKPDKGEYVFTEGNTILTRRWIWRQANHSVLTNETKALEFNIDYFPAEGATSPASIGKAILDFVTETCGGSGEYLELHRANQRISI